MSEMDEKYPYWQEIAGWPHSEAQEQELYGHLTKKFHETDWNAIKEQSVNNLLFELTHDWRKLTPT